MPNPPVYRESGGSAYYVPKQDLVNLPPIESFKTTEGYVGNQIPRYAHSTGHELRLNRPGIMEVAAFGGEDYSFEELVAELTSAYLCARNGINNALENSSAYIQNWLKALKDDRTMLMKSSGIATAAFEYILAGGHKTVTSSFLCIAYSSPAFPGSLPALRLSRSKWRPFQAPLGRIASVPS